MSHRIVSLASMLRRSANDCIEKQLRDRGFTKMVPSHGDILQCLFHKGSLSMQDLAKQIKRTKATTTVLVDRLEDEGLVKRSKSDRDSRITLLSLTKKGKSLEGIFNTIADELDKRVMCNLSADGAELLEQLLEKAISGFSN